MHKLLIFKIDYDHVADFAQSKGFVDVSYYMTNELGFVIKKWGLV